MRALFMATLGLAGAFGLSAQAQTAGDINRLNQAVQICNSPMGAGMAECARLRGQLGQGGGGAAGLMGALGAAMSARQAPAMPPPAANPQLIAECVRAAGGNTAAIQACLATANAPRAAAPAVPSLGQPLTPAAASGQGGGMAIYRGGQSYQACVAANPAAWQSCVHLLNGAAPPR